MFHIVLSVTVANAEQHDRVYTDMGSLQDQLAGTIPSINLSSYDMTSEIPNDEELYLDENTMFKVLDAVKAALPMRCVMKGEDDRHARDIIFAIQNAGILFREPRRADPEEGDRPEEVREEEGERSGADLTVSTNAGE